jgi:DNA-binding IclR family transcriptional regulator
VQAESPYAIDILDTALDVIEGLYQSDHQSANPSVLARQLGINRTRIFRILKTLERRGFVEQAPGKQGYRLGIKFLMLAERVKEQIDLRREAAPILRLLAQDTGDTANLLVRYGDQAVCIDSDQGENLLQVSAPIGQPLPLHIGASPKILLAFMDRAEQERILHAIPLTPFTTRTITNRERLQQHLQEICQQGYAVDEGDFEDGVCAIGAPVRDYRGQVIAGITVTTPVSRYDAKRREDLIERVISAAQQLSAKLGYQVVAQSQGVSP